MCHEALELCVTPEQLTACDGMAEGAGCDLLGANGVCTTGVCIAAVCGDGAITGGEVCDDGNADSGDGCSADCTSDESCGNGTIELDEECDCGVGPDPAPGCTTLNSDQPGAECRSDCVAHCGDGVANAVEECDSGDISGACVEFGFDRGRVSCADNCALNLAECRQFGWLPRQVSSLAMQDVFVADDYTVYTTLDSVVVRQGDSETVLPIPLSGNQALDLVWASSPTDLLISGTTYIDYGIGGVSFAWARRFDGLEWTPVSTATPSFLGTIHGMWGSGPNDVFIVGTANTGNVLHDDGSGWVATAVGGSSATAVAGLDYDHVYVGSEDGAIYTLNRETNEWVAMPWSGPQDKAVTDIAGIDPNDLYAAGEDGLMAHYDGDQWTTMPSPTTSDINAVHVLANGAVFWGADSGIYALADGAARRLEAPFAGPVTTLGTGDRGLLYADGGVQGVLFDFLGDGWLDLEAPIDLPVGSVFSDQGHVLVATNALWHHDGTAWEQVLASGARAISGTRWDHVVVVGAFGKFHHFDGSEWTERSVTPGRLGVAIAVTEDGGMSINNLGRLYTYDGENETWSISEHVAGRDGAVWGSGSDFWVSGRIYSEVTGWSAELAHTGDGSTFEVIPTGGILVRDIWGSDASDVYFVGDGGFALHYDGTNYVELDFGLNETLQAVGGTGASEVFVQGALATVLRFDGSEWLPVTGPRTDLSARLFDDGTVYGTTEGDVLQLFRTEPW